MDDQDPLPIDVLSNIFSCLERVEDVLSASLVSKKWYQVSTNSHLWRRLFVRYFTGKEDLNVKEDKEVNWRFEFERYCIFMATQTPIESVAKFYKELDTLTLTDIAVTTYPVPPVHSCRNIMKSNEVLRVQLSNNLFATVSNSRFECTRPMWDDYGTLNGNGAATIHLWNSLEANYMAVVVVEEMFYVVENIPEFDGTAEVEVQLIEFLPEEDQVTFLSVRGYSDDSDESFPLFYATESEDDDFERIGAYSLGKEIYVKLESHLHLPSDTLEEQFRSLWETLRSKTIKSKTPLREKWEVAEPKDQCIQLAQEWKQSKVPLTLANTFNPKFMWYFDNIYASLNVAHFLLKTKYLSERAKCICLWLCKDLRYSSYSGDLTQERDPVEFHFINRKENKFSFSTPGFECAKFVFVQDGNDHLLCHSEEELSLLLDKSQFQEARNFLLPSDISGEDINMNEWMIFLLACAGLSCALEHGYKETDNAETILSKLHEPGLKKFHLSFLRINHVYCGMFGDHDDDEYQFLDEEDDIEFEEDEDEEDN